RPRRRREGGETYITLRSAQAERSSPGVSHVKYAFFGQNSCPPPRSGSPRRQSAVRRFRAAVLALVASGGEVGPGGPGRLAAALGLLPLFLAAAGGAGEEVVGAPRRLQAPGAPRV